MAGIILLGNVHYEANEKGEAKVSETGESAATIAKVRIKVSGRMSLSLSLSLSPLLQLFQCSQEKLETALTHRVIEARQEKLSTPLTVETAYYGRDASAKAVYERMFYWLVKRLNSSLENKVRPHNINSHLSLSLSLVV